MEALDSHSDDDVDPYNSFPIYISNLLPPKGSTSTNKLPQPFRGHCQIKPPCPIACWTLATQPCLIQYPPATSKLVLRSSNLQLCRLVGSHC